MTAARKPREGDPCNGCGLCCMATPCALGDRYVPGAVEGSPCPALAWAGGRSYCGLVIDPVRNSPALADQVAALAFAVSRDPESAAKAGELLAEALGETIRELLGDGTCDSGPGDGGPDEAEGKSAAEAWPEYAAALEETE